MIEELRRNPYLNRSELTERRIRSTLRYFDGRIRGRVLDLGQRSPLTDAIQEKFGVKIDNTEGDLDFDFTIPGEMYDTIIYSHTLEHQFSPLNTLMRLKTVMHRGSRLFIIVPDRTKLLWCRGHYHEPGRYQMSLLIERAGLKIVSVTRQKLWRKWTKYFLGIRPILRLFLEYQAIYEVKL